MAARLAVCMWQYDWLTTSKLTCSPVSACCLAFAECIEIIAGISTRHTSHDSTSHVTYSTHPHQQYGVPHKNIDCHSDSHVRYCASGVSGGCTLPAVADANHSPLSQALVQVQLCTGVWRLQTRWIWRFLVLSVESYIVSVQRCCFNKCPRYIRLLLMFRNTYAQQDVAWVAETFVLPAAFDVCAPLHNTIHGPLIHS
jgi:hypothetical protein